MEHQQQYVGIDLHRRRSVIVRMTEDGEVLECVRIANDPVALSLELAKAGPDPEVALEATYGWYSCVGPWFARIATGSTGWSRSTGPSFGGREHGKRTAGRGTTNKATVAIAVELLEPKGLGRVRLAHLRQVTSEALCGFVGSVVTSGATVRTDGWNVYAPLAERCGHDSIAISRTGHPAHVALPGVHRVASLLKRWLTGTLHYGYSVDQLDYYLDEFCFRFNRRSPQSRGLLFYRLLQQAVATNPTLTATSRSPAASTATSGPSRAAR